MGKKKRKIGMDKRILIGIGIAAVIIALLVGIYFTQVYKPAITKDKAKELLAQRFSEFESQYQEKKASGYDVTEAKGLEKQAKWAYNKRKYAKADKLLDEAFESLEKAEIPVTPETPTPSPTPEELILPSDLSLEYEEGYKEANNWLDEKLVEWKTTEYKPMKFTGFHLPMSYELKPHTNSPDDLKFLDMLDDLDVDVIGVGIYISEEHPPQALDRWDTLISEIRRQNKELKVWHFGGNFHKGEELKEDYIAHGCHGAEYIINRWQPEYISIVHEISNQQEPKATKDDWPFWKDYIETVANHTKKIARDEGYNITTAVALQASPSEIDFVDYLVDIPDLDIIAFDVYNRWGLCEKCNGGNVLADKIDLIHSHGKRVWIEETWFTTQWKRPKTDPPERFEGFDDPKRAQWDSKWMWIITYYAQKHNVEAVEPFFTNYFILYPSYNPFIYEQQYVDDYKTALYEGKRTPTFYAFKDVIEEVKRSS